MSLDYLKKQRRTILYRLRENLEQIPIFLPIHKDSQLCQLLNRFINFSDPLLQVLVVRFWYTEKLDACRLELGYRLDNVVSRQRNVLNTWAVIVFQVLFNLGLPLA